MSSGSNEAILAQTMFSETGKGPNTDVSGEEAAIGAVLMNRWEFVNGNDYVFTGLPVPGSKPAPLGWGTPGDSIASIAENPNQFGIYQNNPNGSVSLKSAFQTQINNALSSSAGSSSCGILVQAITDAYGDWAARNSGVLYQLNGLILTAFNSFNPPHSSDPLINEQFAGTFGDSNIFYGVSTANVSATLPPPLPKLGIPRPPRKPGSQGGVPQ